MTFDFGCADGWRFEVVVVFAVWWWPVGSDSGCWAEVEED